MAKRDGWLKEKIDSVLAIPIVGSLRKCKRASPERGNGAKHKAGDLVSDEEIMIEWVGIAGGKNLSGSEIIVWKVAGPRRC